MSAIPRTIPIAELAEQLGAKLATSSDLHITDVSSIERATKTEVTFLNNPVYANKLKDSQAGAVLIAPDAEAELPDGMVALTIENPYLAFAHALELFHPTSPATPGIHATAIVPKSCEVPDSVTIGAYVVLGEHVTLGERVQLHPHAVIYERVAIGDDTIVHSHATIREACTVGARAIIQSGVVIGGDGFGFAPVGDGTWKRIPQVGTVTIGDDTDVQAGACIDRAAVGTTVVGNGSRIDNLVQIGHGSRVGNNTLLCGQVGLAGSAEVGNNVIMGGQVGMAGHISVGDRAQVAAQAGIIDDLPGGKQYAGAPAAELREMGRQFAAVRKLPALLKDIRRLKARVEKLEG